MNNENSFHLSKGAAEKYEAFSVPAMFEPLAKATLAAINLPEYARILDVACGTGVISRHLAALLPGKGRIVGCDLNPAMIEVAREHMPASRHDVDWIASDVADMPFTDEEFDVVFMQQGLQFFPKKRQALSEVRRVLAPGGVLIVTCWKAVSPFFQAISNALFRHVSPEAAAMAVAPFSFRDSHLICALLSDAGFGKTDLSALTLDRKIISIRDQILTSPYEKELRENGIATIDTVVEEVERALVNYQVGDHFIVPQETHLIQARVL